MSHINYANTHSMRKYTKIRINERERWIMWGGGDNGMGGMIVVNCRGWKWVNKLRTKTMENNF